MRYAGEDCRIYTPEDPTSKFRVLRGTVFDEFFVGHILGWYGKAIALRDGRLLWAYSIAFELMELTFQHWLKNFNECWWDSWVLDVALCNFLGIYVGMKTVSYFEGRTYDWTGTTPTLSDNERGGGTIINGNGSIITCIDGTDDKEREQQRRQRLRQADDSVSSAGRARGFLKRSIMLFTPASIDSYAWAPTSSPLRFFQCAFIVALCLVFELNAFFLKYVLWIPPPHLLNHIRLALWFGIANVSTREYYVFITARKGMRLTKMGPNAWLALAVALVEIMITIKHGRGMFQAPWPRRVVLFWAVAALLTTAWLVRWCWQRRRGRGRSRLKQVKEK